MYRSSYTTMVTNNYRRDKLIPQLQEAIIKNRLVLLPMTPDTPLYIITPEVKEVDAFAHPLSIELPTRDDQTVFVIDTRPFVRGTRDDYSIKDTMDYEALVARALLEIAMFEDGDSRELYLAGDAPMWVFVNWLANKISGNLGLDPASQVDLQIIMALHYVGFHGFVENDISDSEKARVATRIARVLRMPIERVLDLWPEFHLQGLLSQTVNYARERINSTRIDLLTPASMVQLATGSAGWRGAHFKEVVGIALEHAPTWHFMVYAAINSNAYKRSTISDLLYKQFKDKSALNTYSKTLGLLVSGER